MNNSAGRRAFTVIELGALIAVGGSMTAVFAPVGGKVQRANLDTKSQWVHHDLARRQFVYMGDHDGAFTGPNTSGAEWNKQLLPGFSNPGIETLEFDTAGGNPTNFGDWITPLVGDAYGFSANRALRTQQKFDVVGDPTADRMVDLLFTSEAPDDIGQFESVFTDLGYRQQSFLQMRSFSYYSVEHSQFNFVIDPPNDIGYVERYAVQSENELALSPKGYTPNIMNAGVQLSNKVMFADGTRYYTDDDGLDMSIDTLSYQYTEDSDSGPMVNISPAYGRDFGPSPSQTNLDLSFRKKGGQGMYVTMFDGSLQFLTREEAWTDPTPWYPSGSVWQNSASATSESQAWVDKNLPGGIIH